MNLLNTCHLARLSIPKTPKRNRSTTAKTKALVACFHLSLAFILFGGDGLTYAAASALHLNSFNVVNPGASQRDPDTDKRDPKRCTVRRILWLNFTAISKFKCLFDYILQTLAFPEVSPSAFIVFVLRSYT